MIDVRQCFLGCLAQASYLIVSDGIAAVVDPRFGLVQIATAFVPHGATGSTANGCSVRPVQEVGRKRKAR